MNTNKKYRLLYSIAIAVALILLGGACAPPSVTLTQTTEGIYDVDPIFRELYDFLGGYDVLGPAISPLRQEGHLKKQYVLAGLLVYDPQATPNQRFRLDSLGLVIGISDPPVPNPNQPGPRYVGGHIIYEEFVPLYDLLGGARFVGRPLTEMRLNTERDRYEQYFENLGFYRLRNDPPGTVRLLDYGAFVCDLECRYPTQYFSIPARHGQLPDPFATTISRLGTSLTGSALTGPYQADDGKLEVIFENFVFYADPASPGRAFPRPLMTMLGFPPEPLTTRVDDPRMTFYEIESNLGYNIPVIFRDFIALHGGFDLFGPPITQIFPYEENIYRQCFTNICLDYYTNVAEHLSIQPASLGHIYKTKFYQEPVDSFPDPQALFGLRIQVWEFLPILNSTQEQVIHVMVLDENSPIFNLEPTLTLTLPDGSQEEYHFPPTLVNGQTSLTLPPIVAPNGTLIPYKVCLQYLNSEKVCYKDNFLIWGNP